MPRTAPLPHTDARSSYVAELVQLPLRPARALPRLAAQQGALSLLGFPALSGIFVAYSIAEGLALGDAFGVVPVAIGVVVGGAVLGVIALWFAGTLPAWSRTGPTTEEDARMFTLFSDATWPFLPLLLIVVPVDVYYHGAAVFASDRPETPLLVAWLLRAAVLATIALWLVMMVRGTAVVRNESERAAAGELARWGGELAAIAILFGLILAVSVMFW